MPTSVELRQQAGQFVEQARSILARAEAEKRNMDDAETEAFNKFHDDAERNLRQAESQDRQERAEIAGESERALPPPDDVERAAVGRFGTPEYRSAFADFLRYGETRLGARQLEILRTGVAAPETRATLQQDQDVGGGFFATSEQFVNRLLKSADNMLPIRGLATRFQVARGETLGAPSLDGDLTAFSFGSGELTTATENIGLRLGKRELRPHDIQANVVKFSRALLPNSRLDVEGLVAERVGYALANCLDAAFMTGDGAREPLGLFTASDAGIGTSRDVNVGSTTTFTADGLIAAQGALKDAYDANARWLFHKDAITLIRKLKDGNQQYIWQPGLALGVQNQILGKPYITGDNVPHTFSSALYGGMYGDFSYYWIADSVNMSVQRLTELYALTNQIGLLFRDMACDGMPVLAEAFVRIKLSA